MAGLFGSHKSAVSAPAYTSLNLQTSAQGLPIPIGWGQFRATTNIIWYNNFQAHAHKQKAGKGGGSGSTVSYTYTAALIMALCEGGPSGIQGILSVWQGKSVTSLAALGLTLFQGAPGQSVWSYLTSAYPSEALNYSGTAYVCASNYDLGSSPDIPSHNFEVKGYLSGTMPYGMSGVDANPADIVDDFFNNDQYGVNFPVNPIDLTSWTNWKTYCQATAILFSPYLYRQEQGTTIMQRWAQLSNTWIFWTGNVFKFVPLGTDTITNNGVTYTPNTTPVYDLGYDDFIWDAKTGEGPVQVIRSDPADGYNQVQLDIRDRFNFYNTNSIVWKDQASIDQYGQLASVTVQAEELCDTLVGTTVAALIGKRSVYIRNTYTFKLGYGYVLLEPGDIVTLTDPNIGASYLPVRIGSVEEDDKQLLVVTAEEFPAGIGHATPYIANSPTGNSPVNINADPGNVNTPAIFEPNAALTGGTPQIWIQCSGSTSVWGGADAYISFDGGTTYSFIGTLNNSATQGVLHAGLPIHADPDTTNTLVVDLTDSKSTLPSTASTSDADNFRTLILVGNELMAYGSSVPGSGSYLFDLTYLRRGLYGTSPAAHSTGDMFSRVDPQTTLVYNLPAAYIGSTVMLKFVSFNSFGNSYQDISTVTAYTYVPVGTGYFIAPPTSASLIETRLTQADGTSIINMTLSWTASVGPIVGSYEVQISTDGGTTWTEGGTVGSTVTNFVLAPALASTNYQMRVRAISTTGINVSTWANSVTVNSGALVASVPSAPTGAAASVVGAYGSTSWNASTTDHTINNYQVWRANGTGAFGTATLLANVGSATSYLDVSASPLIEYTYYVVAQNPAGSSTPTAGLTITTSVGGPGSPYDIPMSFTGQPPGAYRFYRVVLARTVNFLANFSGSYIECRVAPTANYTVTVYKNGTSVGTGTITAGNTSGTFTTSGTVTFNAGDLLEIDAPATSDATLADLSLTLTGTR